MNRREREEITGAVINVSVVSTVGSYVIANSADVYELWENWQEECLKFSVLDYSMQHPKNGEDPPPGAQT